ncbi:MAG: DJ-1/PfpI family protein [Candidatus Margulisiibacteriota bacterium]
MQARIAIIIAHDKFRDEEYWIPKHIFENNNHIVKTVSSDMSPAISKFGKPANPDMLLSDVSADHFSAIVFVGGPGASEYFDNPIAHRLAADFTAPGKLLAAICIAPVILSRAGLLAGKTVTVFPSGNQELITNGANVTGNPIEIDGSIITASGAEASEVFAGEIIRLLQ